MVRSTEEARVYGETRSGAIQGWGEVVGSARRRNGRLAAVANGRLGGRPRTRRLCTTSRQISLSRTVIKSGVPVRCTASCRRPQCLNLPQPALQLVPTRENAAQLQPSLMMYATVAHHSADKSRARRWAVTDAERASVGKPLVHARVVDRGGPQALRLRPSASPFGHDSHPAHFFYLRSREAPLDSPTHCAPAVRRRTR